MSKYQKIYDKKFFDGSAVSALSSAEGIVPLLMQVFKPKSVIDIGCANGTWLNYFQKQGVTKILGVDGDYLDKKNLEIDRDKFISMDLSNPKPLNEKADLVISLEVAEHIKESRAREFITFLTTLSDVVVFSAAVPRQGGIYHLNEQWPAYWQNLFEEKGYKLLDPIRPQIARDNRISWWYRQNTFVAIKESVYKKSYSNLALHDPNFLMIHTEVLQRYSSLPKFIRYKLGNLIRYGIIK